MHQEILHYSFDLWFTLIKSNPIFKKQRALYFFENYNSNNESLEFVEKVFRNVDLMCNAINEKTGGNIDSEEMYLMVLHQINSSNFHFNTLDLDLLLHQMENLFFQYAPVLFDDDTSNVLKTLKSNPNTSLNILSNTAFIKGATLQKLLEHLNIAQYFDFQIYSDQVGVSKPNGIIFDHLLQKITDNNLLLIKNQIMHVGDNEIADIQGAKNAGLQTFLLNSNHKSIINLIQ